MICTVRLDGDKAVLYNSQAPVSNNLKRVNISTVKDLKARLTKAEFNRIYKPIRFSKEGETIDYRIARVYGDYNYKSAEVLPNLEIEAIDGTRVSFARHTREDILKILNITAKKEIATVNALYLLTQQLQIRGASKLSVYEPYLNASIIADKDMSLVSMQTCTDFVGFIDRVTRQLILFGYFSASANSFSSVDYVPMKEPMMLVNMLPIDGGDTPRDTLHPIQYDYVHSSTYCHSLTEDNIDRYRKHFYAPRTYKTFFEPEIAKEFVDKGILNNLMFPVKSTKALEVFYLYTRNSCAIPYLAIMAEDLIEDKSIKITLSNGQLDLTDSLQAVTNLYKQSDAVSLFRTNIEGTSVIDEGGELHLVNPYKTYNEVYWFDETVTSIKAGAISLGYNSLYVFGDKLKEVSPCALQSLSENTKLLGSILLRPMDGTTAIKLVRFLLRKADSYSEGTQLHLYLTLDEWRSRNRDLIKLLSHTIGIKYLSIGFIDSSQLDSLADYFTKPHDHNGMFPDTNMLIGEKLSITCKVNSDMLRLLLSSAYYIMKNIIGDIAIHKDGKSYFSNIKDCQYTKQELTKNDKQTITVLGSNRAFLNTLYSKDNSYKIVFNKPVAHYEDYRRLEAIFDKLGQVDENLSNLSGTMKSLLGTHLYRGECDKAYQPLEESDLSVGKTYATSIILPDLRINSTYMQQFIAVFKEYTKRT